MVSGSFSQITGAELSDSALFTYTAAFEKHFPYYLSLGMTYEQYWQGDSTLVKFYREAEKIRNERINQELWLQGLYVYDAILCAAPALRAMGASKPEPYPEQPYPITEEEIAQREEEKRKRLIREKREAMQARAAAHNAKFKKSKGGDDNA